VRDSAGLYIATNKLAVMCVIHTGSWLEHDKDSLVINAGLILGQFANLFTLIGCIDVIILIGTSEGELNQKPIKTLQLNSSSVFYCTTKPVGPYLRVFIHSQPFP
jgi:hypothetical protein